MAGRVERAKILVLHSLHLRYRAQFKSLLSRILLVIIYIMYLKEKYFIKKINSDNTNKYSVIDLGWVVKYVL